MSERSDRAALVHLVGINHEVHRVNRVGRPAMTPDTYKRAKGNIGAVRSGAPLFHALMAERVRMGISVVELARRMQVVPSSIHNMMVRVNREGRDPMMTSCVAIADALGIDIICRLERRR